MLRHGCCSDERGTRHTAAAEVCGWSLHGFRKGAAHLIVELGVADNNLCVLAVSLGFGARRILPMYFCRSMSGPVVAKQPDVGVS